MKTLLAAVACLFAAAGAHAQQYTMKLSAPTINDMNHEWMKAMKAGVEPRSGGRIKVEIYPANQLGQIPRTVEGVALGTIEATLVASGFFVGLDPRYLVFDAPGLFDDMNHGNRAKATWQQNRGELITLPPAEAKRFVDEVGKVTDPILAGMPQVKAEYDALRAAAQKHRR